MDTNNTRREGREERGERRRRIVNERYWKRGESRERRREKGVARTRALNCSRVSLSSKGRDIKRGTMERTAAGGKGSALTASMARRTLRVSVATVVCRSKLHPSSPCVPCVSSLRYDALALLLAAWASASAAPSPSRGAVASRSAQKRDAACVKGDGDRSRERKTIESCTM
jgi:hypothetical protein